LSIQEGNVGSDVEFLSEIMELNETLENGSEDTLRKLRSQIEGKNSFKAMHKLILGLHM
jgi:hypothetical protein